MQLNRAMFVRSFIATAISVLMALSSSADWTYTETNTVQNGTSKGYITDGVWTFHAERAKGDVDRLTVDASTSSKCLIKSESPAKIDFSEIDGGFKVVKFSGGYRDVASPLRKYVTEFIAPHCTTFGGEDTFNGNTNLTRVEFCKDEPLNISSVNRCFLSCVNLVDFRPRQIKGALGSMFNSCSNLEGGFEIEGTSGGTSIGAFSGCAKLGEIKLKNIDTFSQGAFSGCTSLSNIVYDTPIANIGNYAFKNCTKITTEFVQSLLGKNLVRWGNSITDRWGCFMGCTGLTGTIVIDLPNLVTNVVPNQCFHGCSSLERVVVKSKNLCDIGNEAFYAISKGAEVVMPKNVIKGRFGRQAVWNENIGYNVPYPKICLIGDVEAYLDKINETHYIIRKADFEDSAWVHHDLALGDGVIKPSYDYMITTMRKDEAMCTITTVDGKNKVKLLDKRIVGFIYYRSSSARENGCWILAEPKLGLTVTVR